MPQKIGKGEAGRDIMFGGDVFVTSRGALSGKYLEIQAERFGAALKEFTDGHPTAHAGLMPSSATAPRALPTAFSPATSLLPFRPAAELS